MKRPDRRLYFSAPVKPAAPPVERDRANESNPNLRSSESARRRKCSPPRDDDLQNEATNAPCSSGVSFDDRAARRRLAVAAPFSTSLGSGVPGEMTDLSDDLEEASPPKTVQQAEPVPAATVFAPMPVANIAPQKVFGARFDSLPWAWRTEHGSARRKARIGF